MNNNETFDSRNEDAFSYYKRVRLNHPVLDNETILNLIVRAQKGDTKARDKIVNHNQKLVYSIAFDYMNYTSFFGIDPMELIQEGNLGLLIAIERFDFSKKASLATYARWWIKQKILSLIAPRKRIIDMPSGASEKLQKLRKIISGLEEKLQREPSDREILEAANPTIPNAREALLILRQTFSSLDAPIGNEDDRTFGEIIPELSTPSAQLVEGCERADVIQRVLEMVQKLPVDERDKKMFCMYFGLNGEESHTLEEVGQEFGLTRERVRQTNEDIIIKIRIREALLDALPPGGKEPFDSVEPTETGIELLV